VPHHLFDIRKPDETLTLAEYQALAKKKVKEIQARGKIPLLVGGTGLYIDAVVYDYQIPRIPPDSTLRHKLSKLDTKELLFKLSKLDPVAYEEIDHQNKRRIIRALEVCLKTGKPFYSQRIKADLSENVLYIALNAPRGKLYEKLNNRVELWLKRGFEKEVTGLLQKYPPVLSAMSAIGYKQFSDYLAGKISKPQAIEKFKQGDRNLARHQLTWFRKNKDISWIKTPAEAEQKIKDFLNSQVRSLTFKHAW